MHMNIILDAEVDDTDAGAWALPSSPSVGVRRPHMSQTAVVCVMSLLDAPITQQQPSFGGDESEHTLTQLVSGCGASTNTTMTGDGSGHIQHHWHHHYIDPKLDVRRTPNK